MSSRIFKSDPAPSKTTFVMDKADVDAVAKLAQTTVQMLKSQGSRQARPQRVESPPLVIDEMAFVPLIPRLRRPGYKAEGFTTVSSIPQKVADVVRMLSLAPAPSSDDDIHMKNMALEERDGWSSWISLNVISRAESCP